MNLNILLVPVMLSLVGAGSSTTAQMLPTRKLLHSISVSCTTISVGKTPLNDLGTGFYQGYQGGLYPDGSNLRPAHHDSAGRAFSAFVQPRSASGAIDYTNGRIVLLSIGMSNATQEFSMFKAIADTSSSKNPKLVVVDGAQGGQTAAIISNASANFWTVVDQRLSAAGVTRQQVQAAWVKEANATPTENFPRHVLILDSQFVLIARILKALYPNIKLTYWSSRTYGGYATTALNPEPYAYESAFAVKRTVQRQIDGDTALSYTGTNARAPWLAWGPYLWADGLVPRSDGLTWACDDFVSSDRTHPSPSGRLKVAQMLLRFFSTDSTTKPWFLRATPTQVREEKPQRCSLEQNYPNPFNPNTEIRYHLPALSDQSGQAGTSEVSHVTLQVFDLLGRESATLVNEQQRPGTYTVQWESKSMASGVYFYRLSVSPIPTRGQAGNYTATKKMLLLQ